MRILPVVSLFACSGSGSLDAVDDGTPSDPTDGPGTVGDDDDDDDVTIPPTEDCPAVLGATIEAGVQPLEQHVAVTLDGAADVWVTCTSDADPTEVHLLESSGAATAHDLVLRGLLGETDYTCEAHAACGGPPAEAAFRSGAPTGMPRLTATTTPGATLDGVYTLYSQVDGCLGSDAWLGIVDPDGKLRWMYPVGTDLVVDIDAQLIDPNTIHFGGGWGLFSDFAPNRGVFKTIDLSGKVLVERTEPETGLGFNHHSEALPDGSYLDLVGSTDHAGNHDWIGVGIERWSPVDGLVWSWTSQGLVDAGYIDDPGPFVFFPPYHANAVSLVTDPEGEALWVSNFGMQELWRLSYPEGELTHVFGHGGGFDLVDVDGDPLPDAEFPYVQHGPDYTADGRVLVYDNGDGRPGGSYSRVAEYQLDLAANRATLLWSWTEPGWSDDVIGDADYLPNGHVLVTQGFSECLEGSARDVSELVELDPPNDVVWRATFPDAKYAVYRSERYDGCAVFANAKYCPATADRIAALRGG